MFTHSLIFFFSLSVQRGWSFAFRRDVAGLIRRACVLASCMSEFHRRVLACDMPHMHASPPDMSPSSLTTQFHPCACESLGFAAMMGDHRVFLESARLGDWIATRAEPLARRGAGCREYAGWAAEGAGSSAHTSAKEPVVTSMKNCR